MVKPHNFGGEDGKFLLRPLAFDVVFNQEWVLMENLFNNNGFFALRKPFWKMGNFMRYF